MAESIWKDKFDMEKYIEKRILEVSDLKQRKLLKDTLSHLFINLYEHIETEYRKLEDKIVNNAERDAKRFIISTGIIPREVYDETEEAMVPMFEEDKSIREINTEDLFNSLSEKEPFYLYTVFMEADYLIIRQLEREERRFKGVIKTDLGDFRADFILCKNERYHKLIENLYEIFHVNRLPWSTVCAPYLNKLYDVYICSIDNWEREAQILKIVADFLEYQPYVKNGCIPVWNVSEFIIKSSAYPEPCIDKIHYQHIIHRHRLEEDMNYLVGMTDTGLKEIRRIKGDLFITCEEEYPVKWRLLKLSKSKLKNPLYPVFTNQILEDFSDALNMKYQNSIKTKTELERYIMSMGYGYLLVFTDVRLIKKKPDIMETYDADYFIEDEFRTGGLRETMVVYFSAVKPDYYLNRDIMSYIVTRVQKLFPEYCCMGTLV